MTSDSSVTAEYMALFRALESARPASARLFHDPYAARFLRGPRRTLYRLARLPGVHPIVEAILDRAAPGARAAGIARTRWLDDQATRVLAAAAQLVLLGAGFDMRAWRLPAAARAITFELDHPSTAAAKRAALAADGPIPDRIRPVAIDFNRQSLAGVLPAAGFDRSRPACWIWEGVTNYLTAEAIDLTLRQIAQAAAGSILLFTYIDRAVLDHPGRYFGARKLIAKVASYGEPWTFGFDPAALRSYLDARNFELLDDLGVADVWRAAGRSTRGTRGYEFYRLASARVRPSVGQTGSA